MMQIRALIQEASHVAEARRTVTELAIRCGFGEVATGRLAIAVSEAATNILKYGTEGELLIRALQEEATGPAAPQVEVIAIDRGPGMADLGASLRDGFSTTGTAGNGLGAMGRLATAFDIYSAPGKGTVLRMTLAPSDRPVEPALPAVSVGAVCVPMTGETECGDGWHASSARALSSLVVADGLGHGPDAARAAEAAKRVAAAHAFVAPAVLIGHAHAALRATRGAAVAVARIDSDPGSVRFAGIGNISACVYSPGALGGSGNRRQLISHNGIVGYIMRKVTEVEAPWPAETLLVLHSDGLGSHWDLDNYPGLHARHPAVVAAVLYRDFARGHDDVTVIVCKRSSECQSYAPRVQDAAGDGARAVPDAGEGARS
ncbi:ATP-binding protein [Cupriavidus sp. 2TAF22]|uniref:ATP-binding protein n=1 Tax=unclassified Cupriavidus TaxID=2640874 RepID=UPI003F8EB7BA